MISAAFVPYYGENATGLETPRGGCSNRHQFRGNPPVSRQGTFSNETMRLVIKGEPKTFHVFGERSMTGVAPSEA